MNELGVIFDMDGVLVDSYRAHLESWQETAREFDLQMTEDDFARTFGRTAREVIQQLWPGQFDDQRRQQFDAAKEAAYREILTRKFPEMPGVGPLIRSLHDSGFRLAIGSSGPPKNVELVRSRITSGELIDAAVHGGEVQRGKPDPQVFLLAAGKLGLQPQQCAVIEDALVGLKAAAAAGMTAIALTGTADRATLQPSADLVVDALRELSAESIRRLIENRINRR